VTTRISPDSRPWLIAGCLALFLTPAAGARGQVMQRGDESVFPAADTLSRNRGGSVLFDRHLNTFNWIGRLMVDTTVASGRWSIQGLYASNVIQLEGEPQRKLQSTQRMLDLGGSVPVSAQWSALGRWSSLSYADDKSVGLNNSAAMSTLAGVGYAPLPFVDLAALGGYRWDRQGDITDRGPSFDLQGSLRNLELEGTGIGGMFRYREDRISPRTLDDGSGRLSIRKEFLPGTGDSLDAIYLRSRREFYSLADNSIESRVERAFGIANLLRYAVDPEVHVGVFAGFTGRVLDKDLRAREPEDEATPRLGTRIDEFRLDTYLQVEYRPVDSRTRAWLRLGYLERNEEHRAIRSSSSSSLSQILFQERDRQEQSKDNLTRRTTLSGLATFTLSSSDVVTFSGSASILRYDTPSSLNVEDRDEQLLAAMVATRHGLSRVMDLDVVLDGYVSHVVYLLKERSANNNRNYVLRLSPRTTFRPRSWLTSLNAAEVLANYTVYDYEQAGGDIKSFSYRQFAFIDSTAFALTHSIGIDLVAYVKVYERGQLRWAAFEERTENTTTDKTLAAQIRYAPVPMAVFAVGFKFFSQARSVFDAAGKRLAAYLRSVGPTCLILWNPGERSQIAMGGWYEHRSPAETAGGATATFTLNISFSL